MVPGVRWPHREDVPPTRRTLIATVVLAVVVAAVAVAALSGPGSSRMNIRLAVADGGGRRTAAATGEDAPSFDPLDGMPCRVGMADQGRTQVHWWRIGSSVALTCELAGHGDLTVQTAQPEPIVREVVPIDRLSVQLYTEANCDRFRFSYPCGDHSSTLEFRNATASVQIESVGRCVATEAEEGFVSCIYDVEPDWPRTFTAIAVPTGDQRFDYWVGPCSGQGERCEFTADSGTSPIPVHAHFVRST